MRKGLWISCQYFFRYYVPINIVYNNKSHETRSVTSERGECGVGDSPDQKIGEQLFAKTRNRLGQFMGE